MGMMIDLRTEQKMVARLKPDKTETKSGGAGGFDRVSGIKMH